MNPYSYDNSYMGYNPAQMRLNSLNQQKQMIEQQIAQLTAPQPVNINLNQNPVPQGSPFSQGVQFDFNGRYVDGPEDAKKEAAQNLPIVFIDKNNPKLYLKGTDGSFRSYRLEEVQDEEKTGEVHAKIGALEGSIASLQAQMNQIIEALTAPQPDQHSQTKQDPQQAQRQQARRKDS